MRFLRPTAIIAAFLIIAVSTPLSLLSQTAPRPSQSKPPASRQRQPKRPQRADALAPAINELLKLDPLAPESADEKNSDDANASSEEESKPPADDAPLKELVAYWSERGGASPQAAKPSDKVRQRLLEACEDRPEQLLSLIEYLPETTDTHDRLYKLLEEDYGDDFRWKSYLRRWLQRNSRYFRDDLIAAARGEAYDDSPPEFESPPDYSLQLLARLDWEAARPIVETFASAGNAEMATIALSLLYENAQAVNNSAQVEKYRALLKAIVVNYQAPQKARRTALSSLTETEWNGQEEWVISLFANPAFSKFVEDGGENNSGSKDESTVEARKRLVNMEHISHVLAPLRNENPERWLPVIGALLGHDQRLVHELAVGFLAGYLHRESMHHESANKTLWKKEIAQKLAPWLTNPDWAAANDRSRFIRLLVDIQAPELPPGLIWVLEHDKNQDNRAAAAAALTQYRDQSAIPALRRALEKEENEGSRETIIFALAKCGGFSDDEMTAAVEAYAHMVVTEAGEKKVDQAETADSEKPFPLQISIGRTLHESETLLATEVMALRLFERAKALRASQPAVARQILRSIEDVPLRAAELNMVERIGDGWADLDLLKLALENRDSLQKSATDELYGLLKQGGHAAGVAAAILNDEREHRESLGGTDAKAQLALLAGARYLRDKLPVELVSRLLNSPNRALAKAAENYLEVEDSAEARRLVLARRQGEAYILGDHVTDYRLYLEPMRKWEEAMRREIKGGAGLEAIYALVRPGLDPNINGVVIRVRDGKAEISLYEYEVEGRRNVRILTESEFEELKSFTSRQEVDDLGPETYDGDPGRVRYEYLRLTKEGGRRITLDGLRRAPKNPTLHEELSGLFHRLSRSGEFVMRYAIEDKIPGVEVLLADTKQEAAMVCGEGREIRVLIGEKEAYKCGFTKAMCEWHEASSGKLGNVTEEPTACPSLFLIQLFMKIRSKSHYRGNGQLGEFERSGGARVYDLSGIDPGVWKVEPGAEPEKIISGSYTHPIVTPDGKWLVAIKILSEGEKHSSQLVRHNLQTGEEFQIKMAKDDNSSPIVYVAAHDKVLLGYLNYYRKPRLGEINYLLDPETGTLQQVKGEFGPLMESFLRELQPTENPNEFWAAISDEPKKVTRLGRYDSKNFAFTPLVELPGLVLENRNFWVDADAGKIWFTYEGHLLRLPLPQKTK